MAKKYFVSQRKEDKMWQVKLVKGEKAIKLFKTQKGAIAYVETLADKQDASFQIHKKDGKIRKQNY